MKKIIVIIALTAAALFTGCVPMQSKAVQTSQMEVDISEIRQDIWKISKNSAEFKKELETLQAMLNEQRDNDSKLRADLLLEIRELTTEMQILSEKLNDTNARISGMANKSVYSYSPVTGTDPEEGSETVAIGSAGPEELYNTAYADFLKGNYPLAIMGFEEYIEQYPESELSDNALYWVGECHYSQKEFEKAIAVFTEVIGKYEGGDKTPDAILKKGFSYLELNQTAQGVVQLQGLIEKYPHTQAARTAKQKLEDIF